MKAKLLVILISVVALFSFTLVQVEKSTKKGHKTTSKVKPASGLAIEDRHQWN